MIQKIIVFISTAITIAYFALAETWVKTYDKTNYTSLINTKIGLIAGEFDERTNTNPHNGLVMSKDLGQRWSNLGLQGRGITSVDAINSTIYATTYYPKDGQVGLYSSSNFGVTWNRLGPNYSTMSVAVDNEIIYLATYEHGLWVSKDRGQNFVQKIGGSTFYIVETGQNIVLATSKNEKTYRSLDKGETWHEIPALQGKQIRHVVFSKDAVFAATTDPDGIYKSTDNGTSWSKITSFGKTAVSGLAFVNNILYAGKYDAALRVYSIYKSVDNGQTWINTNLNIPSSAVATKDLAWASLTDSMYLFAAVSNAGIYKAEISRAIIEKFKFLNIPWEAQQPSELTDKITSYFDHQYPLLAYPQHKETANTNSALNFLGEEEPYYSSHSGIDFALPYGTVVKAPANGIANFYKCSECGYSIKIDHLNGYQTTYMHLQKDGLLTMSESVPVFVGDIIGKVGMTGNTSGPHLHFEVTKDANRNNLFTDDFPHGRVDPFGWLNNKLFDPWNGYEWTDSLGKHTGQQSKYLWIQDAPKLAKLVTPDNAHNVEYENKKFDLNTIQSLTPFNLEYSSHGIPKVSPLQNNLKYIPNTSFVLEMNDTLNDTITTLPSNIVIKIALPVQSLLENLKLYYFDTIEKIWKSLSTQIDMTTKNLIAETNHLTQFAAFATNNDIITPVTVANIKGVRTDSWYAEQPQITLSSNSNDLDKIFYSIGYEDIWEEYSKPFTIENVGVTQLKFRSSDINGNYEPTQVYTLSINTNGAWTQKLKIKALEFKTL